MLHTQCLVKKFGKKGEKTGWTYLSFGPAEIEVLNQDEKRSFRVKGSLNRQPVTQLALLPMGGGDFILALNANLRKMLSVRVGHTVEVSLEVDPSKPEVSALLIACLEDVPEALRFFNSLPFSHQMYFSRWIESAKTDSTTTKRITMTVHAAASGLGYAEMIRAAQKKEG